MSTVLVLPPPSRVVPFAPRCSNGHDLAIVGTYTTPSTGLTECRECRRDRHAARRERLRDAVARMRLAAEDRPKPVRHERLPQGKPSGDAHEVRELRRWKRLVIDGDAWVTKPMHPRVKRALTFFAGRTLRWSDGVRSHEVLVPGRKPR